MSSYFEYDAPQFVDFNNGFDESDEADKFFDVESETPKKCEDKENNAESLPSIQVQKDVVSPNSTESPKKNIICESRIPLEDINVNSIGNEDRKPKKKREILKVIRRLSGLKKDLPVATVVPFSGVDEKLSNDLSKLSVRTKKRTHFDGIALNANEDKEHCMTTRKDESSKTPKLELRSRSVTKDHVPVENHHVPVENRKRKTVCVTGNVPHKYMAMAEQMLHFQKDTPPRFRTHRRRSSGIGLQTNACNAAKRMQRRTIALTPKLMTSQRSRPVEVLSQQQKEELELEEMKKHQFKPLPLNEKALQPPKLPPKVEKANTVQEPFNLTHVFKKPAPKPDTEPYKFSAKPVPKHILEKPAGLGPKPELPITIPQSPAITKSARHSVKPVRMAVLSSSTNEQGIGDVIGFGLPYSKEGKYKHGNIENLKTEIKPFSFDLRDKEMLERKAKKIQEIFEEEKKAREFKANPLPTFSAPKEANRPHKRSHLDCSRSSTCSEMNTSQQHPFKARSPTVLRKLPFEPTKEHNHTVPDDIELSTERRARERYYFDLKQQEKSEIMASMKHEMEKEKKRIEAEEIAKLRQEAVHKALPMPKFKPPPRMLFNTPLTDPKSPRFSIRKTTNRLCSTNN